MKKYWILFVLALVLSSCTENARARSYGGKQSISIEKGMKVVSASWKEGDVWILTRPMKSDEQPETLKYVEKSNLGVLEGEIDFVESR